VKFQNFQTRFPESFEKLTELPFALSYTVMLRFAIIRQAIGLGSRFVIGWEV